MTRRPARSWSNSVAGRPLGELDEQVGSGDIEEGVVVHYGVERPAACVRGRARLETTGTWSPAPSPPSARPRLRRLSPRQNTSPASGFRAFDQRLSGPRRRPDQRSRTDRDAGLVGPETPCPLYSRGFRTTANARSARSGSTVGHGLRAARRIDVSVHKRTPPGANKRAPRAAAHHQSSARRRFREAAQQTPTRGFGPCGHELSPLPRTHPFPPEPPSAAAGAGTDSHGPMDPPKTPLTGE
jgi:hypothetical protein